MEALTFRSRIDTWLLVLMLGTSAAVLLTVLTDIPPQPGARVVVVLVIAIAVALPLWLLTTTSYRLSEDTLRITSGPFRWTVRIAEIEAIAPTRNPLSSPALSLRRLEIRYGHGRSILISPADQEGFLRAIEARRLRIRLGSST